MFNVLTQIDYVGFALAAVAGLAFGGLWFPVLIAKPYRAALGRENSTTPPPSNLVTNLGPVICQLIVTFTSAVLIEALDVDALGDAAVFGLIVGVGYLAAMTFQIAINPNFPRPLYYGVLNAPYFIVTSVVGAVIITAMR